MPKNRIGVDLTFNVGGVVMAGASVIFDEIPKLIGLGMFWGGIAVIVGYWIWRLFPFLSRVARSKILMKDPKRVVGIRIDGHNKPGLKVNARNNTILGAPKGIEAVRIGDADLRGNNATGDNSDESVGYDLEDVKKADLEGSEASGFKKGFRVRRTEEANLKNTKAEAPDTPPSEKRRKYWGGWRPPEQPKKSDDSDGSAD